MSAVRTVHVRITGRVQGVGYRAWARDEAEALGLSGWVRNTPSGEVEAVLSGSTDNVEAMLALCREGPRFAAVDTVEILAAPEPVRGRFEIRA